MKLVKKFSTSIKEIWKVRFKEMLGSVHQIKIAEGMAKNTGKPRNTVIKYLREALAPEEEKQVARVFNDENFVNAFITQLRISDGLDLDTLGVTKPEDIDLSVLEQFIIGILDTKLDLLRKLYPTIGEDFFIEPPQEFVQKLIEIVGLPLKIDTYPKQFQQVIQKRWWIKRTQSPKFTFSKDVEQIIQNEKNAHDKNIVDKNPRITEAIETFLTEHKKQEFVIGITGSGATDVKRWLERKGYIVKYHEDASIIVPPWSYREVHNYIKALTPHLSSTQQEKLKIFCERLTDSWAKEFDLLRTPSEWILYIYGMHDSSEPLYEDIMYKNYGSTLWKHMEKCSIENSLDCISRDTVEQWCIDALQSKGVQAPSTSSFAVEKVKIKDCPIYSSQDLKKNIESILDNKEAKKEQKREIFMYIESISVQKFLLKIGWVKEYSNYNYYELSYKLFFLCLYKLVEQKVILYQDNPTQQLAFWISTVSTHYLRCWAMAFGTENIDTLFKSLKNYQSLYLVYTIHQLRVFIHAPKEKYEESIQQVVSWQTFCLLYPYDTDYDTNYTTSSIELSPQEWYDLSKKLANLGVEYTTNITENLEKSLLDKERVILNTLRTKRKEGDRFTKYKSQFLDTEESGSPIPYLLFQCYFSDDFYPKIDRPVQQRELPVSSKYRYHSLAGLPEFKQREVIAHYVRKGNIDAKVLQSGFVREIETGAITTFDRRARVSSMFSCDKIVEYNWEEKRKHLDALLEFFPEDRWLVVTTMTDILPWDRKFPLQRLSKEQIAIFQQYRAEFESNNSLQDASSKTLWSSYYHVDIQIHEKNSEWLQKQIPKIVQFIQEYSIEFREYNNRGWYDSHLDFYELAQEEIDLAIQSLEHILKCLCECGLYQTVLNIVFTPYTQSQEIQKKWKICQQAKIIESKFNYIRNIQDLFSILSELEDLIIHELLTREELLQHNIPVLSEFYTSTTYLQYKEIIKPDIFDRYEVSMLNLRYLSMPQGMQAHPEHISNCRGFNNDNETYVEKKLHEFRRNWLEKQVTLFDMYSDSFIELFRWMRKNDTSSFYKMVELKIKNTVSNNFMKVYASLLNIDKTWLRNFFVETFIIETNPIDCSNEHKHKLFSFIESYIAEYPDSNISIDHWRRIWFPSSVDKTKTLMITSETEFIDAISTLPNKKDENFTVYAKNIAMWLSTHQFSWDSSVSNKISKLIQQDVINDKTDVSMCVKSMIKSRHTLEVDLLKYLHQHYKQLWLDVFADIERLPWYKNEKCIQEMIENWNKSASPEKKEEVRQKFVLQCHDMDVNPVGKYIQQEWLRKYIHTLSISEWKKWLEIGMVNITEIVENESSVSPDALVEKIHIEAITDDEKLTNIHFLLYKFIECQKLDYYEALYMYRLQI